MGANFDTWVKSLIGVVKYTDVRDNEYLRALVSHPDQICPYATVSSRQCHTCKLGIMIISEEEQVKARANGMANIRDFSYVCPHKVTGFYHLLTIINKSKKPRVVAKKTEGKK